jgi:hypothetical protein
MTNSSNLELNSGSDKGVDDKVLFGREWLFKIVN